MKDETYETISRILARDGDGAEARDEILPHVYEELKAVAVGRMRAERVGHTLGATALVHEAWMKLSNDQGLRWERRGPFFAAASEAMRRILVDHARKKGSQKRGGERRAVPLSAAEDMADEEPERLLQVDEALDRLEAEDARAAQIVRLRFFGGLSTEDTAVAAGVSLRTVHREWAFAKARLFELLQDEPS